MILFFLSQAALMLTVGKLLLPTGGKLSRERLCARGGVAGCCGASLQLETVCSPLLLLQMSQK